MRWVRGAVAVVVAFTSLVGTVAVATTTPAPTIVTWSAAQRIAPFRGGSTAISCPTTKFCLIVDVSGRAVSVVDGRPKGRVYVGGALHSVSCTSARFCLAGGEHGELHVLRGTTWHSAPSLRGDTAFVSCASRAFCMAVAGNRASAYRGGAWTTPVRVVGGKATLSDVSCTGRKFCMALANNFENNAVHRAYEWDGRTWSRGMNIDRTSGHYIVSVSCVTSSFCLAVSSNSEVRRWNGQGWHWADYDNNGPADVHRVSCASRSFCVAVAGGEDTGVTATRFENGTWSRPKPLLNTGAIVGGSVSCASTTACTAIDFYGDARRWTGSWRPVKVLDHAQGGGYGIGLTVSCGATAHCVAVDPFGNYLAYDGHSWTSPRRIAPTAQNTTAISCVGKHFCLTLDSRARAWIFNGAKWHRSATSKLPHEIGREPKLSCSTTSFCIATTGDGLVSIFNGTRWSPPTRFDRNRGQQWSASCSAKRFCGVVDLDQNGPRLFTYRHKAWTGHAVPDAGPGQIADVSCAGYSFCLLTSGQSLLTYRDGTFSRISADQADPLGASCVTPQLCIVDEYRSYQVWNGSSLEALQPLTDDVLSDDSSISCVAPRTCVTVGLYGAVVGRINSTTR